MEMHIGQLYSRVAELVLLVLVYVVRVPCDMG